MLERTNYNLESESILVSLGALNESTGCLFDFNIWLSLAFLEMFCHVKTTTVFFNAFVCNHVHGCKLELIS